MNQSRRDVDNPYDSPQDDPRQSDSKQTRGGWVKAIFVAVVGILSAIYLINPTFGVFELIPDNLPVIGNLDEGAATALLLSSLAYFGWDLRTLFGRRNSALHSDRRTIDHRGPIRGE
jgi:Protein of unknown function (DUF1232)